MRISLVSWLFFISFIAIFFTINAVSVSGQCQSDQQELLLGLKIALNSTLSVKLMKWNQSTDCCSWDGVSCDAGGRVIELDLSNQSISGAIESSCSLFRLQHLQRLNLAYNEFISAFPSEFDKLANLTYLNLSAAGFTGQIPIEISYMTKLVTLDLSTFWFLDLPAKLEKPNLVMLVQNLTRLKILYLDGVNISANGNEWSQALASSLPNLQVLSMSYCYLSGPIDPSLAKLKSLSVIRLDGNNLSAPFPKFFAEFQTLTSLHLSETGLSGRLPEEILQVPTLQTLDLSFNYLLEGSFPKFPPNASLQTLVLSYTNFGGELLESIGNLGQLRRIELTKCKFNGPIPETIEKLRQLIYLDFSQNNFSGPIPSFTSLRNLSELHLADNQLTGSILSTNWSSLLNLVTLDLRNNSFSGAVSPTLFRSPSLKRVDLSKNQFTGGFSEVSCEFSLELKVLDLSHNKLQGPFPMSVFEIQGLTFLSLSWNNFSGLIPLTAFQKLRELSFLDLSYNNFFVDSSASVPYFTNITRLKLASCNLTKFPDFVKNQFKLTHLDLSNNQIYGEIPNWIWKPNLQYLNLSLNFLVEFKGPLHIPSYLIVVDFRGNQLQGQIPIFPPQAIYLDYSNNNFSSVLPPEIGNYLQFATFFSISGNNFHGSIPTSICNNSYLQVLDLSNNSLSGPIPECLIQMSVSLGVLNLRRNNLSGIISDTFSKICTLQTLDLNRNLIGGKVPKSLANCRMLEVLDIGNNQINDTFPCHLKDTSRLRALVLRSNKFNGDIYCQGNNITWPMLQIIDLASNYFSGKLPQAYLRTWNAMKANEDGPHLKHLRFEVFQFDELSFQDVLTVTIKGQEMELVKILTIFTSIDFSCNKFEGPIPQVIGEFKALHVLNLSSNLLTGTIPSFLGDLLTLESLDLSSNHLTGQLPSQLANLNFLSFLNVSNNKLVGRIPKGTQLQSFSDASFENNGGLCGPPLEAKCQSSPTFKDSPSHSGTGRHIDWNLISVETGFFFGFGIVIAPLIFWKRWRIWYYKHIDRALFRLFPRLVLKNRNHGRRAHRSRGRRLQQQ
ncbi:PREDICTED: receptor-like protein 12 [Theobroma cacao]|uniref:Receptor-like protein 12 n=1 Tax=Theobroma cacao TaxID=3641 RepID=A0AB32V308_THECC|nr:PREDICTED: receptor-like protein 12 [Theobroma cacao]